ncbi:hypothetical protein [uncultured Paludibaculum sp.]|uniref:hypothetical protein n=1 Tax=uncultured Paludibaculum sp. TaxID=1765020 RepID=UPI002AAB4E38|nr:hypothetical protein [uncultured Paludibaculum sp.]
MFTRFLPWAILLALLSPAAGSPGGDDPWTKLLSLAGEWEGTEAGRTTTLTYTVISGGNALMESMKMPAPEPDMVTIYHRGGPALVATHYCSMGSQPRMRAAGATPDGKSIRFHFADITNLAKPDGGHIRHRTVNFVDARHFTQQWFGVEKGKEDSVLFHWARKQTK